MPSAQIFAFEKKKGKQEQKRKQKREQTLPQMKLVECIETAETKAKRLETRRGRR